MDLDLSTLRGLHPRIPADLTLVLLKRAALALQRAGHEPPTSLPLRAKSATTVATLNWQAADSGELLHHDRLRVTEDGAEAVTLLAAGHVLGWQVVRRMQVGEHADWLLKDVDSKRIALEVSGVEQGATSQRLREKMAQVGLVGEDVDQRWAGVVGFEKPLVALQFTRRQRGGR